MNPAHLATIFFTGLVTGGLSCLAVQGGLLAATIAQKEEEKLKEKAVGGQAMPILAFLTSKLISYTVLGFLLGWFGSLFQLSLTAQIVMQFIVVLFMLGTALNILNVHPLFRYFAIQPPKFLTRLVRRQSKSKSLFAPLFLGALTVLIPCGTTQAMMVLAIGSGNPLMGAAILFAFVLGTSPVFFTLGYLATRLGDIAHAHFMKIAAYALIGLAVFNGNAALSLAGSPITLESVGKSIWCIVDVCQSLSTQNQNQMPVQEATITFNQSSYVPNSITIKSGSKVKLNLINASGQGCIQAFTIPKLGIQKVVPTGTSASLEFTAPNQTGQLAFMCSMGMYKGTFNVI